MNRLANAPTSVRSSGWIVDPRLSDDVDRLAAFMGRCTLAHQECGAICGRDASAADQAGDRSRSRHWLVEADGEVVGFAQVWRRTKRSSAMSASIPSTPAAGSALRSSTAEPSAPSSSAAQRPSTPPAGRTDAVGGAAAGTRRLRADPLLLADDGRRRPGARGSDRGPRTFTSERWTTKSTCSRYTRPSRPSFRSARPISTAGSTTTRATTSTSRSGSSPRTTLGSPASRSVPRVSRRTPTGYVVELGAPGATGAAKGSGSRSSVTRSSSSTGVGRGECRCTSTSTT